METEKQRIERFVAMYWEWKNKGKILTSKQIQKIKYGDDEDKLLKLNKK